MQDFKTRPGSKGRKPPRTGKFLRSIQPGDAPRGFTPLQSPRTEARKPRRWVLPGALRGWLRPTAVLRAIALGWLAVGLAWGGVVLWRSPLHTVRLEGNESLTAAEVLQAAGLRAGLAMSQADPFEVAWRLRAHPRIHSADARRLYPGRLSLKVRERWPVLRAALPGGGVALVDGENVVLSVLAGGDGQGAGRAELPLVTGVSQPLAETKVASDAALLRAQAALSALKRLEFPDLGRTVIEAGDPFRLTLRLPGGKRLLMPHGSLAAALGIYRDVLAARPEWLEAREVADFSAVTEEGTGRVVLRKEMFR